MKITAPEGRMVGVLRLRCDNCGTVDEATGTFNDAWAQMQARGWSTLRLDASRLWFHFDGGDCRLVFRNTKGIR